MKNLFKLLTLFILMIVVFLNFANAEVPHLINYQGRLTDASGAALNASYNITFRIYDAENAGNLLWQGTYNNVPIAKGIFSILLGDINDTGYNFQNLAFDKPYWLEIKAGTDEPMKPRQRIASVGYAINSESAEKIKIDSSDPASGFLADKIDNSTIKVDSSTHKIYVENHRNQFFTSNGTFNAPAGVATVYITMVGGGGAGGAWGSDGNPHPGLPGSPTSFSTLTVAGGTGGPGRSKTGARNPPDSMGTSSNGADASGIKGGNGGGGAFGAGGIGYAPNDNNGRNGSPGTGYGAGGGGGSYSSYGGAGGGASGYAIFRYPFTVTPGNQYTATIGLGGEGDHTQQGDGGKGAPGFVLVEW